jgi:nucleoside-diphosphate-sugar epimerase
VWGARGFIGGALASNLRAAGWRVRVLTRARPPQSLSSDDVDCVELRDGDRRRAFDRALDGVGAVFNLAGSSGAVSSNRHPIESLESNCRLQLEFLAACERARSAPQVIFASTRLVYGPSGRRAVDESWPVEPLSVYAAHKLCVEHYHQIASRRSDITYTICRISNPYGEDPLASNKGYGFVNAMIHRAVAGGRITLFGDGRQLRDYIHVDDLTTMLRLCAERDVARNTTLNIGFGSSIALRDAADAIHRTFGGGPVEFCPWPDEYDAVEVGDFVMDTSRAQRVLGYSPERDFTTGLKAVRASSYASQSAAAPPAVAAETALSADLPSFR